jgi:hypothetical protein
VVDVDPAERPQTAGSHEQAGDQLRRHRQPARGVDLSPVEIVDRPALGGETALDHAGRSPQLLDPWADLAGQVVDVSQQDGRLGQRALGSGDQLLDLLLLSLALGAPGRFGLQLGSDLGSLRSLGGGPPLGQDAVNLVARHGHFAHRRLRSSKF